MTERSHHILMVLTLALAGCAAPAPELRVRAQPGVAEGPAGLQHAQLLYARGEYALAIEAYRKIVRFQPQNAMGYAGLALSYDRIGRFDLADRYYQLALALQPRNPDIVRPYAGALARQGLVQRAAWLLGDLEDKPIVAAPTPRAAGPQHAVRAVPPDNRGTGARMQLERLSLGEVALVTRPVARSIATGRSVTIALDDPVAPSALQLRGGSILNGVGRRGQAARMRAHLQHIGWSGAAIGDSAQRPQQSRLIAPPARIADARALAARLPFPVSVVRSTRQSAMVLVLGANAVRFDDQLIGKRK